MLFDFLIGAISVSSLVSQVWSMSRKERVTSWARSLALGVKKNLTNIFQMGWNHHWDRINPKKLKALICSPLRGIQISHSMSICRDFWHISFSASQAEMFLTCFTLNVVAWLHFNYFFGMTFPVEVGSWSHYLQEFLAPSPVVRRISEPSMVIFCWRHQFVIWFFSWTFFVETHTSKVRVESSYGTFRLPASVSFSHASKIDARILCTRPLKVHQTIAGRRFVFTKDACLEP